VRKQLDRILTSATFRQVDRLKRFLSFIVSEALEGRADQLKEYVIGVQVFSKESSFDPRADPIVRVQARRLRTRLVRYYREEGGSDAIVIELPKGGYAPVFRPRETAASGRRSIGAAFAGQNTIAVLSFADHSAAGDLEYFCGGLRQEVIHGLARLEALRVLTGRPAIASAESTETDGGGAAAMVVTGSVRKAGDRLRITLHLIDNATTSYLWSESIDADAGDQFGAQEAAAQTVVKRLEPRLLDLGRRRGGRRPAENLAARNLYLQGRYHLNQRTEESLRKAADFFEKPLVEDANYALAHSGLADAWGLLGHYGALAPAEVWEKAAASAATAVRLDVASAEAHTSLAQIKCTQQWDWVGAEREFRHAIRLDPRYSATHHWYAMSCLVPQGRLDEALAEITLAQSLDPVSSIIARDLAMVHCYRRDFDLALEQCDHAIELNPHFSPAWWGLGFIQEQREDFDEAAAAFERAFTLSPESPRMQAALGQLLALSGKRKQALKVLHSIAAMAEKRYVAAFEFVLLHFALGQPREAFGWLERACRDRTYDVLTLSVDPRFDPWRKEPRFVALLSQMGLCSPAGE
jgi:serine/threonine-protein kinase